MLIGDDGMPAEALQDHGPLSARANARQPPPNYPLLACRRSLQLCNKCVHPTQGPPKKESKGLKP